MLKTLTDVMKFQNKYFPGESMKKPDLHNLSDEQKKNLEMRLNFLLEEFTETVKAAGFSFNNGKVETGIAADISEPEFIDGLLDLTYVIMGTIDLYGFSKELKNGKTLAEEAWDRIQAANMQKVRATTETKRGTTFDCVKPKGWKAPEFDDIIAEVKKGK